METYFTRARAVRALLESVGYLTRSSPWGEDFTVAPGQSMSEYGVWECKMYVGPGMRLVFMHGPHQVQEQIRAAVAQAMLLGGE